MLREHGSQGQPDPAALEGCRAAVNHAAFIFPESAAAAMALGRLQGYHLGDLHSAQSSIQKAGTLHVAAVRMAV